MKSSALVAFVALFALAPLFAFAQIAYNTPTAPTFKALDAATVSGQIHVQLGQTTGGPWTLCLDAKCNTENTAPFVLANESGDTSDTNVIDTTKFTDGAHVATAKNATTSLTASFSIANAAAPPSGPAPPTQPAVTGNAVVSWQPPSTNADGSTLTDLAGFRVYYDTQNPPTAKSVAVPGATVTSYTFPSLATGTWYFTVTAYTAAGAESLDSAVVSKVIGSTTPPPPPPPPDVWIVAKNGTNTTRPVYEAVLPLTGTALVRGNQEGTAAVTTVKCGPELFVLSKNSYRAIADADVTLTSPTYKGRQHVAICVKQ